MPELPDIVVYCEALESRILGTTLTRIRISSPFLVRSVDPPVDALHGQRVVSVSHVGKRIVLGYANHLFAVIHLMIAGRLRWRKPAAPIPKRNGVAAFDFEAGSYCLPRRARNVERRCTWCGVRRRWRSSIEEVPTCLRSISTSSGHD